MFIRAKTIKGKLYAYLVENTWKKGSAKQKVKGYLGRILEVSETPEPALPQNTPAKKIVRTLIEKELEPLDEEISIDLKKKTVRKGKNKVVIKLNGGYLCDRTLKEIIKALYERNEETPGARLAEAFSAAGLRIPQDHFVRLYVEYHR